MSPAEKKSGGKKAPDASSGFFFGFFFLKIKNEAFFNSTNTNPKIA